MTPAFVIVAQIAPPIPVQAPPVDEPRLPILVAPPPEPWLARPRPRLLLMLLDGGAFYERLFSVQAYGWQGAMAVGTSSADNAWAFSLEYAHGQTLHGLDLVTWRLGWSWDWILEQFRFGLGPNFGRTGLDRAAGDGGDMAGGFLGLEVHASYDLLRFSDTTLFVKANVNVDAVVWGPSLSFGFRFDIPFVPHGPVKAIR